MADSAPINMNMLRNSSFKPNERYVCGYRVRLAIDMTASLIALASPSGLVISLVVVVATVSDVCAMDAVVVSTLDKIFVMPGSA